MRAVVIKKAWDHLYESNDHLLFASRNTAVNISTLHPEPVQIFRLWQIYLEHVDPLLKVTHTPSLQGRIIEASSNVSNIAPIMEALMFSIYCTSILSLDMDECQAMFGSSKVDLLTRYQFGCQQALLNCGFLRCEDRDCLTALFLYLVSHSSSYFYTFLTFQVSVRPSTVPQSLSSMLGVAIRVAQRMGIHSESTLAKCSVLEAEMRRRLWWSLTLFDTRISELADFKLATLSPMWDCKPPINVNDSDFRLEMRNPPQVQGNSTDSLFAVVRSELGDFVRHNMFYLNFTSSASKPVAKDIQHGPISEGSELASLEKMIEEKYLKFCDPENPLHFMTIWTTRAYLARCHLMEHHSRPYSCSAHQLEEQLAAAVSYSISMLECDTNIMTSPLTKGFLWLVHFYFPFIAYIQIVQTLKRRPLSDQAEHAWEVMSDNYDARFSFLRIDDDPFFKLFANIVLPAWEAREAIVKQSGESLVAPRIVLSIRHKMAQVPNTEQPNSATDTGVDDFAATLPMGIDNHSLLYGMGWQDGHAIKDPGAYYDMHRLAPLDVDVNQLDWSAMEWDLVNDPAGEAGESIGVSLL